MGVVWLILQCSVRPTGFSNVHVLQLKISHPCIPGQSKCVQLLRWWCLAVSTNFIFSAAKWAPRGAFYPTEVIYVQESENICYSLAIPLGFSPGPPDVVQMCPIHTETQLDASTIHPSNPISRLSPEPLSYGLNCVPAKFICWNPKPQRLRIWLYLE